MTSIPIILSGEHSCNYLPGKRAQSLFVHPDYSLTPETYAQLLAQGFRRSGDAVYAPHCMHCSDCIPARVSVADFKPDRSQKRCWKKNRHTRVVIKPAAFDESHFAMYVRYQNFKHAEGSMASASPSDYLGFLGSSWCETRFVEFSINDELAAVAVIDQFASVWSAVYTFYEPKFSRFSPGVYAVLWQIEQLQQRQSSFLYLGYWIENCQKMAYKSSYQPLQLFIDGCWRELSTVGI